MKGKVIVAIIVVCSLVSIGVQFLYGLAVMDTYSHVIVPTDYYVMWFELKRCPSEISSGEYTWFHDVVDEDVLDELRDYIKENDVVIRSGDYSLGRVRTIGQLKERLRFIETEKVAHKLTDVQISRQKSYK